MALAHVEITRVRRDREGCLVEAEVTLVHGGEGVLRRAPLCGKSDGARSGPCLDSGNPQDRAARAVHAGPADARLRGARTAAPRHCLSPVPPARTAGCLHAGSAARCACPPCRPWARSASTPPRARRSPRRSRRPDGCRRAPPPGHVLDQQPALQFALAHFLRRERTHGDAQPACSPPGGRAPRSPRAWRARDFHRQFERLPPRQICSCADDPGDISETIGGSAEEFDTSLPLSLRITSPGAPRPWPRGPPDPRR